MYTSNKCYHIRSVQLNNYFAIVKNECLFDRLPYREAGLSAYFSRNFKPLSIVPVICFSFWRARFSYMKIVTIIIIIMLDINKFASFTSAYLSTQFVTYWIFTIYTCANDMPESSSARFSQRYLFLFNTMVQLSMIWPGTSRYCFIIVNIIYIIVINGAKFCYQLIINKHCVSSLNWK